MNTARYVRSFLKWPGGKYRLLQHILPMLPSGTQLVEPFVGAGSVFLNTQYDFYQLNDINADLISTYKILKKEGKSFIQHVKPYFAPQYNKSTRYYELREKFNHCDDKVERAALFIYLNRHGYNGLCRYNSSGYFNVPFGQIARPYFPQDEMLFFRQRARHAEFNCIDFSKFMAKPVSQAVFYCDPPYVPLSKTASFTTYHRAGFSMQDQSTLASLAEQLMQKGTPVLISNHDLPEVRQLYQQAKLHCFPAPRSISCKGKSRQPVNELVAYFDPNQKVRKKCPTKF